MEVMPVALSYSASSMQKTSWPWPPGQLKVPTFLQVCPAVFGSECPETVTAMAWPAVRTLAPSASDRATTAPAITRRGRRAGQNLCREPARFLGKKDRSLPIADRLGDDANILFLSVSIAPDGTCADPHRTN